MAGTSGVLLGPREQSVDDYLASAERRPLFLCGDARAMLAGFADGCIDCAMTSPPYWGQRAYAGGGIGLEGTWQEYIENLLGIVAEIQRVLSLPGRSGSTLAMPTNKRTLDPFAGTGTTNLVAFQLGRRSIGIEISAEYILTAEERCRMSGANSPSTTSKARALVTAHFAAGRPTKWADADFSKSTRYRKHPAHYRSIPPPEPGT
jgi:DNA modification methylase